MCYKFPGPRCSSHAKKRLRKIKADFQALQTSPEKGSPEWVKKEFAAGMLYKEALDEYDETSAGQKALTAVINNPQFSDEARQEAKRRKQAGAERREHRINAYKIVHDTNEMVPDTEHRAHDEKIFHLGTDLDETSGGFVPAFREALAKKYGLTEEEALARYPEPEIYNLAEAGWFKDREEFMAEFKEAEKNGLYNNLRPMENLASTMKTLVAEDKVAIHVVTARDKEFNKDTLAWLQAHRIPVISVQHNDNKPSVEGMHAFIDDAPYQIEGLTKAGRKVIIFEQKTNTSLSGHRVRNWEQVPSIIRVLKKESV